MKRLFTLFCMMLSLASISMARTFQLSVNDGHGSSGPWDIETGVSTTIFISQYGEDDYCFSISDEDYNLYYCSDSQDHTAPVSRQEISPNFNFGVIEFESTGYYDVLIEEEDGHIYVTIGKQKSFQLSVNDGHGSSGPWDIYSGKTTTVYISQYDLDNSYFSFYDEYYNSYYCSDSQDHTAPVSRQEISPNLIFGEIEFESTGFYDVLVEEEDGHYYVTIQNTQASISDIADQKYTGEKITVQVPLVFGTLNLEEDVDYTCTYTNNIEVGTATVEVAFLGNYSYLDNISQTFKIKYMPVVTAPEAISGLVYDGNEHALVKPGETSNGTMLYSLDGESYLSTVPVAKEVGTYTVYYKVPGDDTYLDVAADSVTVDINKQKFTISVSVNDSEMGCVSGLNEDGIYEDGSTVDLVATANEGYEFDYWEDDAEAAATRQVVVTANKQYVAVFKAISVPTGIEIINGNTRSSVRKYMKNGQLIIEKDGTQYDVTGRKI